jgi:alpha-L-rhamnosidase
LPALVVLAALWLIAFPAAGRGLTVTGLQCEQLTDPEGIDARQPRLSWVLESREPGQVQTAFQVIVASSPARLEALQPDLWDSGKVVSDQSVRVRYQGRELASHGQCFWKVRVWDKAGKVSPWSQAARWTMGLFSPEDWRARWIGLDGEERTNYLEGTSWIWSGDRGPLNRPVTNWFRRVITLPPNRQITRALFQYTGDNECRGWLNIFDLGARNNYRTVKWNDITTRLEAGRTYVFGLVGRHDGPQGPAGVVGLLTIEFAEGAPLIIPTDDRWKVSTAFEPEWNTPTFDDGKWRPATVLGPVGTEPWGKPRTAEERRLPARWLRKEFAVGKPVRRATVSYCGLGLSELYLNGRKVGDEVLSPALSQYDQRVFYVTHEVTSWIREGQNAVGVVLGGGRFCSDRSRVYAGTVNFGWPKLLLQLRIEHTDGTLSEVVTDETWKLTTNGPILANGEFDGEEYDARKEMPGWDRPGYSGTGWESARLVSPPPGVLAPQMQPPIRVTGTLKPVKMSEPRPGTWIFDLGQNMVGWCRLRVRGPAGTQVRLRHAETLAEDGTLYMANLRGARATDLYTLKGTGLEIYEPRFTYHGFRFVEVTGFPGKPTLSALEGRVVNDDLPQAGEFTCSNPLLNRIYRNATWGIRGNYRSIPTDCPQRDERQGWLGDRSEECRGESYVFDISSLYPKWLQDISDSQRPSGSVPDVVPAYWPIYSDNVTWPSTLIIAPGVLHRQYADLDSIAARFESAVLWVNYMRQFFTNGIIARDSYGDWCVPPEDLRLIHSKDPARQTDKALLATAYFYHDLTLMARYARLLGRPADAARFADGAREVKEAFHRRFFDPAKGYYDNGSQTACILPLAFGLAPEEHRAAVFGRLVDKIENESRGHVGTGLIGGQHLMRVLSDHGRADLAYRIATQEDYPGWGYMVNQGATTIWELWNGNTADPTMNSGNHVMLLGDLVIWFYEYLAGIAADPDQPGFKHVIMKPCPVGDLSHVQASHRSPYGIVRSEWRRRGKAFDWRIEVPPNATATVYVPANSPEAVGGDGKRARQGGVVEFRHMEQGRAVFRVGSGTFRFTSN